MIICDAGMKPLKQEQTEDTAINLYDRTYNYEFDWQEC